MVIEIKVVHFKKYVYRKIQLIFPKNHYFPNSTKNYLQIIFALFVNLYHLLEKKYDFSRKA